MYCYIMDIAVVYVLMCMAVIFYYEIKICGIGSGWRAEAGLLNR